MFALLLITFVNFVGIGALIPVLPYTVIENLGYSETVMTALLASFALAMFIANPILGRLSDRTGRQPVLLVSLIIGTAAHLWFALSNDIISMFAARIIAGLSAGNIGSEHCPRLPQLSAHLRTEPGTAPRIAAHVRLA